MQKYLNGYVSKSIIDQNQSPLKKMITLLAFLFTACNEFKDIANLIYITLKLFLIISTKNVFFFDRNVFLLTLHSMKIFPNSVYLCILLLANGILYAQGGPPGPPPPAPGPPGTPIDDFVWLLLVLGIVFSFFVLRKIPIKRIG